MYFLLPTVVSNHMSNDYNDSWYLLGIKIMRNSNVCGGLKWKEKGFLLML